MKTRLNLDEILLTEAMRRGGFETKCAAVNAALV